MGIILINVTGIKMKFYQCMIKWGKLDNEVKSRCDGEYYSVSREVFAENVNFPSVCDLQIKQTLLPTFAMYKVT